jgi:succinoglycan biosynthesis protein ExoO
MPMYNAQATVHDAITSCIRQTHEEWELLIIDDCSTDNSLKVARSFEDSRIRVFTTSTNSGPATARNIGLDNATGDWITVLDADDAYISNRLAVLLEHANREPRRALLVDSLRRWHGLAQIPAAELSDGDSIVHNTTTDISLEYWLNSLHFAKPFFRFTSANTAIRYREEFKGSEDTVFFIELAKILDESIRYVMKPMYLYRDTPNSLVKKRKEQAEYGIDAMNYLINTFSSDHPLVEALVRRRYIFMENLFVSKLRDHFEKREIVRLLKALFGSPKHCFAMPRRLWRSRRIQALHV